MPKKYCLKDILKKIDRNKTTLIRWEEMGLLPEAKRDSRGWRYYTKNEVEEIISLIKNTNNFKNIFSKKNNINYETEIGSNLEIASNEIPCKINFLGVGDDLIKKDFGYSAYLINSFKDAKTSLDYFFYKQKNKVYKVNKFILKGLKNSCEIDLNKKIMINTLFVILFLTSSFLFFNQLTEISFARWADKPIYFVTNALMGVKDTISYLNNNTPNFIADSLMGAEDTILYLSNNSLNFVSNELNIFASEFKEKTHDAGNTIGNISSFAKNAEDVVDINVMNFLQKKELIEQEINNTFIFYKDIFQEYW